MDPYLEYSCQVSLSVISLLAFWQSYFRAGTENEVWPIWKEHV